MNAINLILQPYSGIKWNQCKRKKDYHGMKLINDAIFVCGSHVASKHELKLCEKFENGKWSDNKKH